MQRNQAKRMCGIQPYDCPYLGATFQPQTLVNSRHGAFMLRKICRNAPFLNRPVRQLRHAHTARKPFEPLRILFCGSDEFSITSLRALHDEHLQNNHNISSIDVVCRPAKPVGRGLKTVRKRKIHWSPFPAALLTVNSSDRVCC